MSVKGFDKGAISPLLSCWRSLAVLAAAALLSACSRHISPPPFTASGYTVDNGVVRLWRKDNETNGVHLYSVFSPWNRGVTSTSEYRWQGETLTFIEHHIYGSPAKHVLIRFDVRGALSFMQHVQGGDKRQLSSEEIALYRYHAKRVRETSDALRAGRVVLLQGRWQADKTVTTCEGKKRRVGFDEQALHRIAQRQKKSSQAVGLAWLEAPGGVQLLLVSNSEFCHWQPKAEDF